MIPTSIAQLAAGALPHSLISTLGSASPSQLDGQSGIPQTANNAGHAIVEPALTSPEGSVIPLENMNHNRDEQDNDTPTPKTFPKNGIPWTPPSIPHEPAEKDPATPTAAVNDITDKFLVSTGSVNTQLNHRSPPTPDDTPPRRKSKLPGSQAPPTQRYPSSRAESFTTAQENFSSDDEGNKGPPSLCDTPTQAMQNWLDSTRSARLESTDLGLGVEPCNSDNEDKFPKLDAQALSHTNSKFTEFDGAWDREPDKGTEAPPREWNTNISRNVTLRRKPEKRHDNYAFKTEAEIQRQPLPELSNRFEADQPGPREPSLRDRIENHPRGRQTDSMERFAKEIEWPFEEDSALHGTPDVTTPGFDNRRLSAMSATSTIVEAMIVDTTPQRHRTLRHTGKNLALRRSDPAPQLPREGRQEFEKRLSQPETKTRKRNSRASPFSNGSLYGSRPASLGQTKLDDVVPIVVIPERTSSFKSSTASSREQSRAQSLIFQDTPEDIGSPDDRNLTDTALDDTLKNPLNPKSEAADAGRSREKREASTVPVQSSSHVGPTNRSKPHTPSLILNGFEIPKSQRRSKAFSSEHAPISSPIMSEHDGEKGSLQLSPDVQGERSLSWHTSAYHTPFSGASMTSSTEGLEVREATAVSIFPHHNHSLLVVQQLAQPGPRPSVRAGLEMIDTGGNKDTALHTGHPLSLVQSPLKNPRAAPAPPEFKVIPPTPLEEHDRQIGSRDLSTGPTRAFSMVRRALTTRRFSDSIVSPFARLQTYKTVTSDKKRVPSVSEDTDNRLHPFWRPRGFWDDLEDSEAESDSEDEVDPREQALLTAASFSRQQSPHRTLSLPGSSLRRRWGTFRNNYQNDGSNERMPATLNRRTSRASLRSTTSSGIVKASARQRRRPRATAIPALGIQIEYVGFKGLKERLRERKERKAEEAREARREKIRQSIGPRIITPDTRYF
ncbi:hypothetical protein L228DRAFT_237384 [Xylona heveae TC161]|uniref:Uncharacterized protein n=1 Tax=Xylona heveae (strain CBS 132557 / TC161) TaxID=1328760 RepID=A0A165I6I8_XYLHT|nr:hypothetical protein L228DRAFT_237384 [Xylona heveae TC161]KZF24458.1 hypothetical protein L228DRAFT_237384 [Xylona heveae TC161]